MGCFCVKEQYEDLTLNLTNDIKAKVALSSKSVIKQISKNHDVEPYDSVNQDKYEKSFRACNKNNILQLSNDYNKNIKVEGLKYKFGDSHPSTSNSSRFPQRYYSKGFIRGRLQIEEPLETSEEFKSNMHSIEQDCYTDRTAISKSIMSSKSLSYKFTNDRSLYGEKSREERSPINNSTVETTELPKKSKDIIKYSYLFGDVSAEQRSTLKL